MSGPPTEARPFDRSEPIPGYRTVALLGRGGYGEVWQAVAPGGLSKAVKIVYGDGDAAQAATELRALARIKDARHPLLLSIERIEVVDGHLVIVTELADGSLKDRFAECRAAGGAGIPQAELLRHVGDVADALDHLYSRYSLQHLDIKPENILLFGGRSKVGDFGLVKSLYERSASFVGGLTPTYASPELFEGRPTHFSDQYSLAVLFMQMLTGTLPFAAASTAQLAAAHLHGIPDLEPLPRRLRSVVARALSKDPAQRHATCTAFAEALRAAATDAPVSVGDPPAAVESSPTAPPARGGEDPAPGSSASASASASVSASVTGDEDHPPSNARGPASRTLPVATDGSTTVVPPRTSAAPVLVVGVGGTGAAVVARLMQRLRDRCGEPDAWPVASFLVLDSDTAGMTAQFGADDATRVRLVPLPLKASEAYAEEGAEHLRWLDRRWLYGVPRDRTTGGYRPLGRLALATHARRVVESVDAAVAEGCEGAAARGTFAAPAPRVLLVGAVGGGTGSGILLDAAYLVRDRLRRRGLSDEQVHGLLVHGLPRGSEERDRSRACAYALLAELAHYSRRGSHYPGEPLLDVPPFHGDNPTFARSHLLRFGAGLGPAQWEAVEEQVAEFAYAAAFTPAATLLDEPSPAERAGNADHTACRLYDFVSLGVGGTHVVSEFARRTSLDVVRLWREGTDAEGEEPSGIDPQKTARMRAFAAVAPPSTARIDAAATQMSRACGAGDEDLLQDAAEVSLLELGGDVAAGLERIVDEALAAAAVHDDGASRIETVLAAVDFAIGFESADRDAGEGAGGSLYDRCACRLAARSRDRVAALLDRLRSLVDCPSSRVDGARRHATALRRRFQGLGDRVLQVATEFRETALEEALRIRRPDSGQPRPSRFAGWGLRRKEKNDPLREALVGYARIRVEESQSRAVAKLARLLDAEIALFVERLDALSRSLAGLAEPLRPRRGNDSGEPTDGHDVPEAVAWFRDGVLAGLGARRAAIAARVVDAIDRRQYRDGCGLSRFLDPHVELAAIVARPLHEESRRAVLECIRQIAGRLVAGSDDRAATGDGPDLLAWLAEGAAAQESGREPALRPFVVAPDDFDADRLRERVLARVPDALVVVGPTTDVTLVRGRRDVSLHRVAEDEIAGIDLFRQLAVRLRSRRDVEWSALREETSGRPDAARPAAEPLPERTLPLARS